MSKAEDIMEDIFLKGENVKTPNCCGVCYGPSLAKRHIIAVVILELCKLEFPPDSELVVLLKYMA